MGKKNISIALFRDHPAEKWFSMERYANGLIAGFRNMTSNIQLEIHIPPPPWRIPRGLFFRRMIHYPFWARRHQSTVNHIVDHSYGHLLFGMNAQRSVITIHDIAPLLFPGHKFGLSGLAWRLSWQGAIRAKKIIAVSEFTRQQVIKQFGVNPARICLIPEGVESSFQVWNPDKLTFVQRKFSLPDRFLLHVGGTHPRKNIEGLLKIVAGLNIPLVQAGGRPTEKQTRLMVELGIIKKVKFLGKVSDPDLIALYNLATALLFPSLYEGFGFPPLEAMACGTPVISSNLTSLPEIVGDAGLLVNPHNIQAFQDAVMRVLENDELAHFLRTQGLKRAKKFNWEATALQTSKVYESLS